MLTRLRAILAGIVLSLSGCAGPAVLSEPGEALGAYAVPKATVFVTLQLKAPRTALCGASAAATETGEYSLTITKHEVQLVPAAVIPLHYDPSAFSSDQISVETDGSGFLKEVKVDLDDKTGEFIGKLADLGIAAAKVATVFPASILSLAEKDLTLTMQVYIDPYKRTQNVSMVSGECTVPIKVTLEPVGKDVLPTDVPRSTIESSCENRVCYPMLSAMRIRFDGPFGTTDSRTVLIPDPSDLQMVDLTRAALVKKSLTATFDKGILTKVTTDKPSEALAFVQIPLDIATKLVALPSELVQLKIDTTEDQSELLKAQQGLIEAQESLLEAVEKARIAAEERSEKQGDTGTGGFND